MGECELVYMHVQGRNWYIYTVFIFLLVKSYWYYTEGYPGRVMSSVAQGGRGMHSLPLAGSPSLRSPEGAYPGCRGAEMPGCPLGRELGCCRNARTIKALFPLCRQGSVNCSAGEAWNPPAPRREQQICMAVLTNRNHIASWSKPWCFWEMAHFDRGSGRCVKSHEGQPLRVTPVGWWTGYLERNVEQHQLRCGTCRPGLQELQRAQMS